MLVGQWVSLHLRGWLTALLWWREWWPQIIYCGSLSVLVLVLTHEWCPSAGRHLLILWNGVEEIVIWLSVLDDLHLIHAWADDLFVLSVMQGETMVCSPSSAVHWLCKEVGLPHLPWDRLWWMNVRGEILGAHGGGWRFIFELGLCWDAWAWLSDHLMGTEPCILLLSGASRLGSRGIDVLL